ncbi:hypothetical protein [Sulfobacillus harzensis]|uniref:Uncharacterized protein n=1 Tax=Sulfobacillus harzensis TaxID=2729629 RepID=A0A7Y0L8I9_9FIRM|nr:hypothetical protein [Sulfobacillus harzensis]NMP24937.1 hypothetical protein [Sulfobacillus harzensis]
MSDRMTAMIVVPTFALDLEPIREVLEADGPMDEQEALANGTTAMTLYEAPWGEFADLEAALVKAGIAFNRYSDAKYEYDAEVRYFRPSTDTEPELDRTVATLSDHTPVISLDTLQELGHGRRLSLKAIRAYLGLPRETVAMWARRHRRRFRNPAYQSPVDRSQEVLV